MRTILLSKLPFTGYPYKGAVVACPVCEETGFEHIASLDRRIKHLPTVMCSHCGLLYTNPMPDEQELTHYYASLYRLDYQAALSKPTGRHLRKSLREATWRVDHLSGLVPPGGKTMDFGCGSGEFVAVMVERGFDAHGFEPGKAYGSDATARLGDRITISRWQDMRLGPDFDLVTSFHVIEHLRDPMKAIAAMASWIKPDGGVYIEVPDLGGAPNKGIGSFHFAHVIGFNHFNLRLAGARQGLRLDQVIKPTGLVFKRGEAEDADELAARGLELARSMYVQKKPIQSYLGYQWQKVRRAARK